MRASSLTLLLACLLTGCGLRQADEAVIPDDVDTDVEMGPPTPDELPSECRPESSVEIQALYDLTEDSVHELITCGGIQMQVALSMKLMIFTSNEDLISASAKSDIRDLVSAIGMTTDNPFAQSTDGTWVMEAGGAAGSAFELRFYDPTNGEVILLDPFSLDSYLLGVTATSSRTWEEMKANPSAKTTFTYNWTEEGPLSHFLADGGTIPNPIVLEMSLLELGGGALGITELDYGPFESVQDVAVESKIHMIDDRGGVDVTYDVTGRRSTVRNLVESGSLSFDVDSLASTDGTYSLDGNTEGLAFVGQGSLAGEINYSASGGSIALSITSDFGAGAAYPTPRWACP